MESFWDKLVKKLILSLEKDNPITNSILIIFLPAVDAKISKLVSYKFWKPKKLGNKIA